MRKLLIVLTLLASMSVGCFAQKGGLEATFVKAESVLVAGVNIMNRLNSLRDSGTVYRAEIEGLKDSMAIVRNYAAWLVLEMGDFLADTAQVLRTRDTLLVNTAYRSLVAALSDTSAALRAAIGTGGTGTGDGVSYLSGSGPPGTALGTDGSVYWDTNMNIRYQKLGGKWRQY